MEDEDMPIDQYGVRADAIFCNIATVNRMNLARRYEPRILSSGYHTSRKIYSMFGFTKTQITKEDILKAPSDVIDAAWNLLMGFYQIVSPKQYSTYSVLNRNDSAEHLAVICTRSQTTKYGIRLFCPIKDGKKAPDIIREIKSTGDGVYDVPTGPVKYRGDSGRMVTTKTKVRIAPMYVFALDKISDDNSSVASVPSQMFGVPAVTNKANRYIIPTRANPTRTMGETEGRLQATVTGPVSTAEVIDRNNNPEIQSVIYRNILTSEVPTNIPQLIDRDKYKYGGSKPLQNGKHILFCAGFRFKYVPYKKARSS